MVSGSDTCMCTSLSLWIQGSLSSSNKEKEKLHRKLSTNSITVNRAPYMHVQFISQKALVSLYPVSYQMIAAYLQNITKLCGENNGLLSCPYHNIRIQASFICILSFNFNSLSSAKIILLGTVHCLFFRTNPCTVLSS